MKYQKNLIVDPIDRFVKLMEDIQAQMIFATMVPSAANSAIKGASLRLQVYVLEESLLLPETLDSERYSS
jgi:hypothetical protein